VNNWASGIYYPDTKSTNEFVSNTTFGHALRTMLKEAQERTNDAYDNNDHETGKMYEVLVADIRDIADDEGIMDDPDMWEEQTFYLDDDTEWYIGQY